MNDQATLQSIGRLLKRVTEEVDGLKAEMATLKAEFAQIKAHAHDIEARVDNLEQQGGRVESHQTPHSGLTPQRKRRVKRGRRYNEQEAGMRYFLDYIARERSAK
jgi:predicted  nucleic acid-binding Zn-ribbon protein